MGSSYSKKKKKKCREISPPQLAESALCAESGEVSHLSGADLYGIPRLASHLSMCHFNVFFFIFGAL